MIHLKCPRGHALTAPDDKVGKSGKCPECGVRFRVPRPGESRTAVESGSSGSGSELQRAEPAANLDRPIVFLCPNGHRLNGPARLAGKPGQCPHCNERFLIPTLEELGEYEQEAARDNGEQLAAESPAGEEPELEEIEELTDEDVETTSETSIGRFGQSDVRLADESTLFPPVAARNGRAPSTLAASFARLWKLKEGDEQVEIMLKTGQTLVPEKFSGDGEAALVATRQENGKLRLTAIAWDAVAAVQLSDVEKLPGDLFD